MHRARAENTDDPARLSAIFAALDGLSADLPVVVPLHPRTRARLAAQGISAATPGLLLVEPVGFLDMMALLSGCGAVLTDSGGLQKEACFLGKPCATMRDETEWVETVEQGWNVLAGADRGRILSAARGRIRPLGSRRRAASGLRPGRRGRTDSGRTERLLTARGRRFSWRRKEDEDMESLLVGVAGGDDSRAWALH